MSTFQGQQVLIIYYNVFQIEYLFQERYLSFCAAICRHVWKGGFTSERQGAVPWIKELSETYGDLQAGLMENHNHGCREIHDKPDEVKGPHVSLKQGENLEKFKFDKNRGTEYAVAVVLQKTDTDLEKIPVQSEDLSTLYLTCGQPSWFEPSTYSDGNLELTTQLPATWKMKNLGKFCVNGLITTSQNVSSMECKNLTVVDVSESLVETLPDFRVLPKVREVNASHSMVTIQSLTSCHIDQLKYLVSLSLDELLLDSLPRSFGQLKTLQYLSIKGIPWLRGDEDPQCGQAETSGLSNSVAKVAARTSCIESPNELLKKYDYDNNDILNVKEEIPGLNTELFMSVPRLGQTFKDADSSGIPLAVFEMENLRELRLANQGINSVPQTIAKLKRLRVLELSNNPLLESVAGEVAFLPIRDNVGQGLKLDGCPSLKSPPNDIVGRGGGAVISFLKRVAGGFTVCRRTKLMFVGLGGAGKTSLLRALMSGNYKTKSLGAKEVTDGIDIKAWTVKKNDGPEVTFSTWDFAGQKVYYNTHQFFLSSRAVYLLLWTTRSGYEHAGLEFWLSSIASHAPGAPVFVIGTRADEVDKPEIPMEKLQKKFPQIAGFHFISSLTGQGIRVLEDRLVDVTLAQKYMGEQIPTVWLKLETAILTMKEKKKVSIVKWEEIAAMANEVGIYEEDDLKEAIQFLTYLGSVQYFDNEFLRKYVVINPQWIADVMACVVSIKANAIKDGRLNHSDIGVIWKAYDKEYHEWLLMLTQEFDLTFPLPDQKVNLVPCLLPGEEPKYDWPDLEADSGIRETRMLYQFTYLPTGLFNRAQVRLFQFTDGKAIWKEGSFLKKNAHIALIKQTRENELSVKVQGPEPENVLLLIHEVFEGLIAEAYHGVTYTYLVQCPDCVNKQRTHDPFLFPNNLIRQASNHAGAFLQCHRFFHSISLNELEAIMPPDSKSDLDMQLENSIRKLRDMRKNNSTDILVSYCAANLTENAADPIKVVQDINNMGYTCWFDEDIGTKTLSDFIVPLKDSKLLLAMVSKEYAEDEKCKELFQYASQKLKKPYVIVTITKSFDWTKSELGMNIGLQEIFVDLSKEDVYDTKLDELKEKLKSKLEEEEKKEQDAVDVFISYCWSNSHDAVKKGTAEKDGALGWEKGDPREIRSYLESQGVRCWLDIEQAGKTGLFEDISEGLKKAKVVVACVSDERANSP
ncbi:probable serine/threonine-protein kinase roco5 [Lingula anatina]|uniref:non-specific serine/threonine protein kinase n=1 Tax=Lingula anatina TaxID=7574 RepID=A0A1S3IQ46_LINAN|nr:probable serine/threonine-protein kinase roco5 [Lingula anatina]|eukprot:XP_013400345.1 probable serine/threonine-protein kinase roco5 [Lingula anatina]